MKATTYFEDFLAEIRLPDALRTKAQKAHTRLRDLIESDDALKGLVVTTFLQGSYRRHTGIKPEPGKKCDVDVVVVTRIDRTKVTPQQALDLFKPFLEKHYKGQYRIQGRSWRIIDGDIELDLVPTSGPGSGTEAFLRQARGLDFLSELSDYAMDRERLLKLRESASDASWRDEVLWIPDREVQKWRETNPLAQIDWTFEKNDHTNGHYVNVVKVGKWWRRQAYAGKHPKGYPLEHVIGANCPDGIESVAEGFTLASESIVLAYKAHRQAGTKPKLLDHGVRTHDVFGRLTEREFAVFYDEVEGMAKVARKALEEENMAKSVAMWRSIFGDAFPEPVREQPFTARTEVSSVVPGRFA